MKHVQGMIQRYSGTQKHVSKQQVSRGGQPGTVGDGSKGIRNPKWNLIKNLESEYTRERKNCKFKYVCDWKLKLCQHVKGVCSSGELEKHCCKDCPLKEKWGHKYTTQLHSKGYITINNIYPARNASHYEYYFHSHRKKLRFGDTQYITSNHISRSCQHSNTEPTLQLFCIYESCWKLQLILSYV